MPRKCLWTHAAAWALIVGLLTLASPVAFAVAPVQDQQDMSVVENQSTMVQIVNWFTGVWEKFLSWQPDPTVPANTTETGTEEDPDLGPYIEPNG